MSRNPYLRIIIGLWLIGILAACNAQSTPVQQPDVETSTPMVNPTETPLPTATVLIASPTATPAYAPFCEPAAEGDLTLSQCQLPIAEQSSVFCTKKNPYNLILLNEGATYETLDTSFKCSDAGMKDGKQMVTCTGPMASNFELRVCDPACAIPTVQADITQCPPDYFFNNIQGCCTQDPQPIAQNCELLTFQTTSCIVDCSEFTKRAACDNNSYTCIWDPENKICQPRK
jgi:hypothetical protein